MKFKLQGIWEYSPKLLGDRVSEKWYLIIKSDTGVAKYYRHLYHLYYHRCRVIQAPAWREHVTIVRDEEPPNKTVWEKYHGQSVDFYVYPESRTNGEYFWLPVECPQANQIRLELGLPENPMYNFHMSFGHVI